MFAEYEHGFGSSRSVVLPKNRPTARAAISSPQMVSPAPGESLDLPSFKSVPSLVLVVELTCDKWQADAKLQGPSDACQMMQVPVNRLTTGSRLSVEKAERIRAKNGRSRQSIGSCIKPG